MTNSKAQIVVTLGPVSGQLEFLEKMVASGLDVVRLNKSWGTLDEHRTYIQNVRVCEEKFSKQIPIIMDLPGPRIQKTDGHTYDKNMIKAITEKDKENMQFGVEERVDYFAISFVGNRDDILEAKEIVKNLSGKQKIMAKIERQEALINFQEILSESDAIMIARGDLGEEIPVEQIPFIEKNLILECNKIEKPVITATQMMWTMTEHPVPTRAEVTDVAYAIVLGSDAVMLSDETAHGKYPLEAVQAMEKITKEAEKHISSQRTIHLLERIN